MEKEELNNRRNNFYCNLIYFRKFYNKCMRNEIKVSHALILF